MGFDAVAQGQAGAGVDGVGVGVVEGVAEFGDGGGVPWRREWVEPDVQGVGGGVGDDVAGAGQGGADQGEVHPGQQVLDTETKLIHHAIRIAAYNTMRLPGPRDRHRHRLCPRRRRSPHPWAS